MKKFYIYIMPEEKSLIIEGLVAKKNSLIAAGKYSDGVDDVLLKIMKSKLKRVRTNYV